MKKRGWKLRTAVLLAAAAIAVTGCSAGKSQEATGAAGKEESTEGEHGLRGGMGIQRLCHGDCGYGGQVGSGGGFFSGLRMGRGRTCA